MKEDIAFVGGTALRINLYSIVKFKQQFVIDLGYAEANNSGKYLIQHLYKKFGKDINVNALPT